MKLASWNVNGIRAVAQKGFFDWLKALDADVICLQETKASPEQLDLFLQSPAGYRSFWHSAQKPGYSGVATFCKSEPLSVREGLGIDAFDSEGRVLTTEFQDFYLVNAYFPNSQREHARLGYKVEFCEAMLKYLAGLRKSGKGTILCGDYNIAHTELDLANPKTNQDNAGFLPEERAWMTKYLEAGYVDVFRLFEKGKGHYTWWSYRPGVRAKNIGWRIDYHTVSPELVDRVKKAYHQPDVLGSDHCPVILELR